MKRIKNTFTKLKGRGEKALILYLMAGDPDLGRTYELILALERSGVDILEIGVPFSDPTADGPVIQEAARRSLRAGTTLEAVLKMVERVRQTAEIPIVLFSYYNPIFAYGNSRFAREAKKAGVDGLLVVDLPPEEAGELRCFTDPVGIDFITLVAPTTDEGRLQQVTEASAGFIYYISVTGVTGTKEPESGPVEEDIRRIKGLTDLPVAVGFGISTADQVKKFAAFADGVVIGSAFVQWLERHQQTGKDLLQDTSVYVRELKKATITDPSG